MAPEPQTPEPRSFGVWVEFDALKYLEGRISDPEGSDHVELRLLPSPTFEIDTTYWITDGEWEDDEDSRFLDDILGN